ncbi:hypothetical protein JTE90_008514 [Oedothorax gibbosus]|uniref:Uncharacterized protein n=1 Tax=Oedothorax gibbosus TaxID=931172 RepID=A0AAV6UZ65_9ARAC|nr:hypothetical protein JTE90_008514 [Oedothorax gibbosus]
METHAGWVLCGSNDDTTVNNNHILGVCNAIVMKAVSEDETSLRKFWELDAIGITDGLTSSRTVSDDEAMHIFDSTIKFENSRYEVCLPWKFGNVDLPNNFYNAKKRLDSLNNRFKKDPELYRDYKAVIEDYINTVKGPPPKKPVRLVRGPFVKGGRTGVDRRSGPGSGFFICLLKIDGRAG